MLTPASGGRREVFYIIEADIDLQITAFNMRVIRRL